MAADPNQGIAGDDYSGTEEELTNKLLGKDLANRGRIFLDRNQEAQYKYKFWGSPSEFLKGVVMDEYYGKSRVAWVCDVSNGVHSMIDVGGAHIRMSATALLVGMLANEFPNDMNEENNYLTFDAATQRKWINALCSDTGRWGKVVNSIIKEPMVTAAGCVAWSDDKNNYVFENDSGHFKPNQALVDSFVLEAGKLLLQKQ